ncbi:MAG: CBM96 family carbohydrate-binding protein, partial [Verrucomicrobiota bacterium]
TRESFLRFDVSGWAEMEAVTLRLMPVSVGSDSATTTVAFELVTNDAWDESGITWNNKPAGSGAIITNLTGFQLGQAVEVDVTAVAKAQAAVDGLLSLRIYSITPGNNRTVQFGAREQSILANRPFLAYTQPAPVLVASLATNRLRLSWTGAGFGLFSTPDLAPPVMWSLVTNGIIPGPPFNLDLPISGGSQFFRLGTP